MPAPIADQPCLLQFAGDQGHAAAPNICDKNSCVTTWTKVSWFCRRILESVHITPHVIYAVLTQEALNPFIECTFGLLTVECLSITFKLGPKLAIYQI